MLLMVEEGIRYGICHNNYQYAKVNNKYMEDNDNIRNHHIISIGRGEGR